MGGLVGTVQRTSKASHIGCMWLVGESSYGIRETHLGHGGGGHRMCLLLPSPGVIRCWLGSVTDGV
jgi:hypothetical protein